jgi:DNA mismatch repair protein MutH
VTTLIGTTEPTLATPELHRTPTTRPDWDELAATVAVGDRDRVAAILDEVAPQLATLTRSGAPLVVLQRAFGQLHRREVRLDDGA